MDSLQIRLSGSGGQGLQLGARILAQALSAQGYAVAQSQAYEPTSRGGLSRSDIVASPDAVDYPLVTALDVLVVLDTIAARGSDDILKESTLVLVDGGRVETPAKAVGVHWSLPLLQSAREVGEPRGANMVALGALSVVVGGSGTRSAPSCDRIKSGQGAPRHKPSCLRGWTRDRGVRGRVNSVIAVRDASVTLAVAFDFVKSRGRHVRRRSDQPNQ